MCCDVCYREIGSGERYVLHEILKADIPPAMKIDFLTVDADGNLQIKLCLGCAKITGVHGEEAVN